MGTNAMNEPARTSDRVERDPRVYFAAERTTLAWIRTGITLMGFGFVVARFGLFLHELAALPKDPGGAAVRAPGVSLWTGTALMLLGVWINVAAAIRHFRFRACYERGDPFVTPRGLVMVVLSVMLGLLGIGLTVYLIIISRP